MRLRDTPSSHRVALVGCWLGLGLVALGLLPWLTAGDLTARPLFDLVRGNPDFPFPWPWALAIPALGGIVVIAACVVRRVSLVLAALAGIFSIATSGALLFLAPSYTDIQWPAYATLALGWAMLTGPLMETWRGRARGSA